MRLLHMSIYPSPERKDFSPLLIFLQLSYVLLHLQTQIFASNKLLTRLFLLQHILKHTWGHLGHLPRRTEHLHGSKQPGPRAPSI